MVMPRQPLWIDKDTELKNEAKWWEWALFPFTSLPGQAMREMQRPLWEERSKYAPAKTIEDIPQPMPYPEWLRSIAPGGERERAYQKLPLAEQFMYEAPTFAIPGPELALKGIPYAIKGAKAALKTKPVQKFLAEEVGALGKKIPTKKALETVKGMAKAPAPKTPEADKLIKALDWFETPTLEKEATIHATRAERTALAEAERQIGKGEEAFIKGKAALRGKMAEGKVTLPEELRITGQDYENMVETIRKADVDYYTSLGAYEGLQKIFLGEIPHRNEIAKLAQIFGWEFAAKASKFARLGENIISVLNLPRAIQTAIDLSAVGRQAVVAAFGHPIKAMKVTWTGAKAFLKESWAEAAQEAVIASKYHNVGKKAGLSLSDWTGKLAGKEEAYMSKFTRYIPGIKQSERAYVVMLNKFRQDLFDNMAKRLIENKKSMRDLKEAASIVNALTGRGSFGKLDAHVPLLASIFYSPRLQASRVMIGKYFLQALIDPRMSKVARVEILRDMVSFVGTNLSILGALQMSGVATIETNPRSTDFMKIRIGNTRLDPWGGFQQYAKLIMRLITGETKNSLGQIRKINKWDELTYFMRTKFAPIVSLGIDILAGETMIGEELTFETESLKEQAYNRLSPLFIQDMIDAMKEEGFPTGLIAAPGFFGTGVVTYKPSRGRRGVTKELQKYRDILGIQKPKTKKKETTLDTYRELLRSRQ